MFKRKKFKTAAEKQAFKAGIAFQFNKEHPLMKWEIVGTHKSFNHDGSLSSKFHTRDGYKNYKEAKSVLNRINEPNSQVSLQKKRVLKAIKAKNVNEYDSSDCSYTDYRIEKVSKPYRKK